MPKFIWMLMNNSIYFPRVDRLPDPYEGSLGGLGRMSWQEPYRDLSENQIAEDFKSWSRLPETMRSRIFVNSWHMKEYESVAMWELYADTQNGLAIQSTVQKLIDSFKNEPKDVYIGRVKYIDYLSEAPNPWNTLDPFLHKLRDFEHENELRAIIYYQPKDKHFLNVNQRVIPKGLNVSINMEVLVEKIIMAPNSSCYLEEIVASLCNRYKKKILIAHSTRKIKPVY